MTVLFIICSLISGQGQDNVPAVLQPQNLEIKEISERISPNGWVYIKPSIKINPDEIFIKYKQAYGLGEYDEMKLMTIQDEPETGMKHFRYQQFYKGIIIEGANYIVHDKDGSVVITNGNIIEGIDSDTKPLIEEKDALNSALDHIKAEKYAWEDSEVEKQKKIDLKDTSATNYPKAEIVFVKKYDSLGILGSNYVLAYKFEIRVMEPDYNTFSVYIDANTSEIIKIINHFHNASGEVQTAYYGKQYMETNWRGWWYQYYELLADDNFVNDIETRKWTDDQNRWSYCHRFTDSDNKWGNGNENDRETAGPTVHWIAQGSYNYYKNIYNKQGTGHDLRIWVKEDAVTGYTYQDGYDNIFVGKAIDPDQYDQWYYIFYRYLAAIDIIGHEYTHGIIHCTSHLGEGTVENSEANGLNESFADIFGTLIERYLYPSDWNWRCGERVWNGYHWLLGRNVNCRRSMENPSSQLAVEDSPWEYGVTYSNWTWQNLPYHRKAGPQNYWFYILSNGWGSVVNGIGVDKAATIAYVNMTYWLNPTDGYYYAREGSINAARSRYGECSPEYISTMNAWYIIGVGEPAPDPCEPPLSVYISGPPGLLRGQYGTWYAHPSGGTGSYSYKWYVDYGMGYYIGPRGYQSTYSDYMNPVTDYMDLKVNVTSGTQQQNAYFYVFCLDCGGSMLKASVYPNPSDDLITINIEESETSTDNAVSKNKKSDILSGQSDLSKDEIIYTLYNNFGQVVYWNNTTNRTIQIDVSDLQRGIYILKIIHKDAVLAKQILVE